MRILIVDDDKTFCQLLTELLEDKGHEVEWTSHGLQGYKMSQRKYYDLFIFGPHAGCAGDGARRRFKRTISWHKNNLGLGICRRAAAERCKKSWHSASLQAFYHGNLFGLGRENRSSKIPMTPRFKKTVSSIDLGEARGSEPLQSRHSTHAFSPHDEKHLADLSSVDAA